MSRAPKTAAPETATVPVLEMPKTGGSFIRQPDGSLIREDGEPDGERPGTGEAPSEES